MSDNLTAPLAVTLGDPAGIGPEITIKAWRALKADSQLAFAVIAPPSVFDGYDCPVSTLTDISKAQDVFHSALPVLPINGGTAAKSGQPSSDHAPAITDSIKQAVKLCLAGRAGAMVTNPISKDVLYKAGFTYPGHTEYLGHLCEGRAAPYTAGPIMMLAAQDLRVGLVTVHQPLITAAKSITQNKIINAASVMLGALKTDFGIENPRLALAGLNPHAGENGALGQEEIETINPAAQRLRHMGHDITNAQSADTLFHAEARKSYDAVLAMYHDQGLIPVKTLDFYGGVNITLGLPIIRTSPDHGTAFEIAGKGIARADSLIAALKQARNLANQRARHGG